jgi:HEAT repeat protein
MAKQKRTREEQRPDIQTTVQALIENAGGTVPATVFYGLSNLTPDELAYFDEAWQTLDPHYRRKVLRRLVDVSESNFELDYNILAHHALDDADAGVRDAAVELLFEDMSVGLMDRLIEMSQWDENPRVRAAAASAVGRFIYAGELEEFPERDASRAQDAMVTIWTNDNEDIEVRRRALEALSNSSHELVEEAIREAYSSFEHSLQVSALYAMGRSADERWAPMILRELDSDDPEKVYEAARSAGELMLNDAIPALVRMAGGSDREVGEVAIWALGEIGGRDAMRALNILGQRAEEADDRVMMEFIEDAVATASMADIDFGDDWDD